MAVEREAISKKSKYIAIKTPTYVQLAEKLDIRDKLYSSSYSTQHVMESLCWLAYEQQKYQFILSIVKFSADLEFPHTVVPGPAAAVGAGPAPYHLKRDAGGLGPPVEVAPDPAAAVVPGPAKLPRFPTALRKAECETNREILE